MSEVLIQDTSIAARDGYALAATVFTPAAAPRRAVLINSATAVPRKIYRGFAAYLAEQGCAVVTYDYRGIGGSRPASLRGFTVRMRDWAALDVAGAIDHMRARLAEGAARRGRAFVRRAGGRACAEQPPNLARAVRRRAGRLLAPVPRAGEISRLRDAPPDRLADRAPARLRAGPTRDRRGPAARRLPRMDRLGDEAALFL